MPDVASDSEMVGWAIAREAELRAEIERRNDELKELEVFLSVSRRFSSRLTKNSKAADAETEPAPSNDDVEHPKPTSKTPPRGMRQQDFVPFVRALLLEHGRPMEPREMLNVIRRKGRHVGGTKELPNLKTKLFRAKDKITHISGSGHWPIDVACPEVSYTPP